MRLLLTASALLALGCAAVLRPDKTPESCETPWKVCVVYKTNCYYCQEATTDGATNCTITSASPVEVSKKIDLVIFGDSPVEMSWLEECKVLDRSEKIENFF